MTAERTFTITFVPRGDVDGVRAVRRLLKHAGRYFGLRAIDVREERASAANDVTTTEETDHFAPTGE